MRLDDETLSRTLEAFEASGRNQTATAEALGVARSTLQARLREADTRNMGKPSHISRTTTLYRGGEGDDFALQWVREDHQREKLDALIIPTIKSVFEEYKGLAVLPPRGAGIPRGDLLTVYPLADLHLGMYSWAEETGTDYDLYKAEEIVLAAVEELVGASPYSDTAVLLDLGDFFHADNTLNQTQRSKNILDVDTRWAKVLKTGVQIKIKTAQLALQKHKRIIFRQLPGNHDPHTALALAIALDAYFTGSDRVTVDTDPGPFWHFTWGNTMLAATHGDMAKLQDLPGIMAAKWPEEWGRTQFRYAWGGHWHTKKKQLVSAAHGAQVEVFETLAPRDAWGNAMGFTAGRSMVAITFDKDRGERMRNTVAVAGPA